jgi:hypothetical protein
MVNKFIAYIKTFKGFTVVLLCFFALYVVFKYFSSDSNLASVLAFFSGLPVVVGLVIFRGIVELFIKRKKKSLLGVGLVFLIFAYYASPFISVVFYANQVDRVANREATNVASCEVIEYGYHGCGGPASYLIYSSETTDVEKLKKLVEKHYEAGKKVHGRLLLMSTCDLSMRPDLRLENNKCVGISSSPILRSLGDGEYQERYERFEKTTR